MVPCNAIVIAQIPMDDVETFSFDFYSAILLRIVSWLFAQFFYYIQCLFFLRLEG
jgi:hypothetical protein